MKPNERNEFNQPVGFLVENWSHREPPGKITLAGQYCDLVPLNLNAHAQALFNVLSAGHQGDAWTYLPSGAFTHCEEFISWLKVKLQETDTFLYVISEKNKKNLLGMCGYLRTSPEHGVIEIGHLHFSLALRRTRMATEAIFLLMSYVFDVLSYRRCEWKCHNLNEASKRAAQRFGFQFEGIFRQCNVFQNRNRDTAWFSVLDNEWPPLKNKFQQWLDASNFNEAGVQKKRLEMF